MKIIKRIYLIKRKYYVYLIYLTIIILLVNAAKNSTNLSVPIGNLSSISSSSVVHESSTSSQSSFFNLKHSFSINSSFRNELIQQRLRSYFSVYENSSHECDLSRPLNAEQNHSFAIVLKTLDSLRQKIVPYPNEYFQGRGIVLTIGSRQVQHAKANLKMIQLSNTRLPVQVNRSMNGSFIMCPYLDLVFI